MFDQQQIIEDVKKLLKDLDNFFSVTLKKEKLKKDTIAEKDKLYGQIKETLAKIDPDEDPQEDYDDVSTTHQGEVDDAADSGLLYDETAVELPKPRHTFDNVSHTGSQKSSENDDDNDEEQGDINYEGTKIRPKSVNELGIAAKEGILDKKRKEGQFGFSAWQSRFCIIKDNMMYYYKSRNDSKQCNEIDLSGYEAVSAPDVEKKHKRKQFLIMISKPGCRSFQFIAPDEKEMKSWIDAINFASSLAPPPPKSASGGDSVSLASNEPQDFGEEYEELSDYQKFKLEEKNKPVPKSTVEEEKDYGDEYEDLDDYQKFKLEQKAAASIQNVPSFEPQAEEPDDFGDEYEDLDDYQRTKIGSLKAKEESGPDFGETYDDAASKPDGSSVSVRHTPLPPPPVEMSNPPPQHSQTQPLPPPPPTKSTSRDLPQLPAQDLPPPPEEMLNVNGIGDKEPWEKDFENIYMGKWDCHADEDNELEFKRGDLIHILSQEYGGWWIGEKNYRVGLVPKDFLMKAYI